MRIHLLLCLLAVVSNAIAQPTLRIGANTRVVGSGAVQLVYGGGALTNSGSLSLPAGQFIANGPTTYGGTGTGSAATVVFSHNTGNTTLSSLLSVTDRATLSVNTALNANNQLYLRTDQFPNANMVNEGILSGLVQGLVTKATLTTGATPYASTLSVNMAGSVVRYQWQSSPNNTTFTDVPSATGPTYTASLSAPAYYRCRLTTSNSSYDQTTPVQFLNYTGTPATQTVCRSNAVVLNATTTGSRYEWYKNGQSAPFKLTEIASIQKGTATASLTVVSIQTTAKYYCKVFQANGSFTFDGPYQVAVNYGCVAPGARIAAVENVVPEVRLSVTVAPNPVVSETLRAVVRGAGGTLLTVDLVDLQGTTIRTQQWPVADSEQVVEWSVGNRPAGLYLLRAQSNGQVHTVKVVKQ